MGPMNPLGAGVEEPDAAAHDVRELGPVNALDVGVVGASGMASNGLERIHPSMVLMAYVGARSGHLARHVPHDALQLVLELDAAAGRRVDDGPNAVAAPCRLRGGADAGGHARPGLRVKAQREVGGAGRVVTPVVPPVHRREVRRREPPAGITVGLGQRRDEGADLVCLAQQAVPVLRAHQVVPAMMKDPREAGASEARPPSNGMQP